MAQDFYRILEVDRKADDKAIKASFRRLARKFHPDLNPGDKAAETKFKEINNAYEVLSDPEKRKMYDQYGENWENVRSGGEGYAYGGGGIEDIFGQMFENFGSTRNAQPRTQKIAPRDVVQQVEFTLEELDAGTKRTLTYQVEDACKSCNGTGQVRLRSTQECSQCRGSGMVSGGFFGGSSPCPGCEGTGKSAFEQCPSCRGTAVTRTTKKVEVTIPAGIPDGKKLRVPGRGGVGTNGKAGDLYVVVREIAHKQFRRSGEDLVTEVDVPFTTAALGGEIHVPTLRNSVSMRIPGLTQGGQTFRLAEQGMAKLKGGRSNLMVKVRIQMPTSLTDEQRELLQKLARIEVQHAR